MNGSDWLANEQVAAGSKFYVKAARDLYNAARRDLEAGRDERGGELARAAEAMTHVPEHLARVGEGPGGFSYRPAPPPPPERPEPRQRSRTAPARSTRVKPATRVAARLIGQSTNGFWGGITALTLPQSFLPQSHTNGLKNHMRLAKPHWALWLLFPWDGGDWFHAPVLAALSREKGLSDRAIGIVSTLAALSALAQFPVGLWSDRIGWRKPFLVVALAVVAVSTVFLRWRMRSSGSGFWSSCSPRTASVAP